MDFISTGTEILKQENVLTPRQKDIIDTEKEMLKSPFDRNTAIGQVEKNCMSYRKKCRREPCRCDRIRVSGNAGKDIRKEKTETASVEKTGYPETL